MEALPCIYRFNVACPAFTLHFFCFWQAASFWSTARSPYEKLQVLDLNVWQPLLHTADEPQAGLKYAEVFRMGR